MSSFQKEVYIFVSAEDEYFQSRESPPSFFEKFLKKFTKQKKDVPTFQKDFHKSYNKLISSISKYTNKKCFSFHLDLKHLHNSFIENIKNQKADKYYIYPMYPQYSQRLSFIADFFSLNFETELINRFFWIKSFHQNPVFIKALQKNIKTLLKKNNLNEKNTTLLFMANSLFKDALYFLECEISSQNVVKAFPYIEGKLYFFSPDFHLLGNNLRKNIILISITNLIDDDKTQNSLQLLKSFLENQNKNVFICKSLNYDLQFIRSVFNIIEEKNFLSTDMLSSFKLSKII